MLNFPILFSYATEDAIANDFASTNHFAVKFSEVFQCKWQQKLTQAKT